MIIGLAGRAGAGKSVCARYLIDAHGYYQGKFARALKAMTATYLRCRGVDEGVIDRMIEGNLKETSSPHMNGRSPRQWMQLLGHEFGRVQVHPDLWVDTEMDALAGLSDVVFDDVRYPNEVAAILKAGGVIVKVTRPDQEVIPASGHSSETGEFDCDVHLINDSGLQDLFRKIDHRLIRGEAVPEREAA